MVGCRQSSPCEAFLDRSARMVDAARFQGLLPNPIPAWGATGTGTREIMTITGERRSGSIGVLFPQPGKYRHPSMDPLGERGIGQQRRGRGKQASNPIFKIFRSSRRLGRQRLGEQAKRTISFLRIVTSIPTSKRPTEKTSSKTTGIRSIKRVDHQGRSSSPSPACGWRRPKADSDDFRSSPKGA